MAVTVLARIPADTGKVIRCSHTQSVTVGPQACEHCSYDSEPNPAVAVVEGERDSFGFEAVFVCQTCLDRAREMAKSYDGADDVEDRAGFFWVSEGYNHDDGGPGFFGTFTSYRAAVAYLRTIERLAAPRAGLYPDAGVREAASAEELEYLRKDRARGLDAHYSDDVFEEAEGLMYDREIEEFSVEWEADALAAIDAEWNRMCAEGDDDLPLAEEVDE